MRGAEKILRFCYRTFLNFLKLTDGEELDSLINYAYELFIEFTNFQEVINILMRAFLLKKI